MSFLMPRLSGLSPYVPGTHTEEEGALRLNSNESPYPPSPGVSEAVAAGAGDLNLYNDPDCMLLRGAIAERLGVKPQNVMAANGSDQVLLLAMTAFADAGYPIALPDLTYSYYDDFAAVLGIPLLRKPLREDFTLDAEDYKQPGVMALFPNPNAPTGLAVSPGDIRAIAKADEGRVCLVDEAYVDFGCASALPLIAECPNLLITRTFSKSGSLAGARLGYALGAEGIIEELSRVRSATDLYGVSRMAQAAGIAAMREWPYYEANCRRIEETRGRTTEHLRALGFEVLPSLGNFVFAKPPMDAALLQRRLAAESIYVRRLSAPRALGRLRITIGTDADMDRLLRAITRILEEER
ncbi:MAG: aminotransferase class I/II-fold pyridoxal phosphate-dependent enzyme [Clostridia bacterium]|nr:aminotransferase class I/II-fold pyridoxal phosphate-dependent enzyme [Clostridia bacterium]